MMAMMNKGQNSGSESDDLEVKAHFASRYINELLFGLQAASAQSVWPISLPVPGALGPSVLPIIPARSNHQWFSDVAGTSGTAQVNCSMSSSPSEAALDLSTRSESADDSNAPNVDHSVKMKNECNGTASQSAELPIFPLGIPKDMESLSCLQSVFDWIPSYQVFMATKEYMNLISHQTLTKTSAITQRYQLSTVQQETSFFHADNSPVPNNIAVDLCRESHCAKFVTKDSESTGTSRNALSGSSDGPHIIPYPIDSSVCNQATGSHALLNPLLTSIPFHSASGRYSPPLNFSAFASLDQNMVCPICRKCFRFEKNLLRHLQKTHATGTGESVLKCKLCNYTTRHYSNMYVHIRTHTGDKPYSCSACGISFTQGSSLKLHIRSRHEDNAKYFSLTRKPGKNNLTKLWTRVLKKDLPKYNSALTNTFFSRPKYWTPLDPMNFSRYPDCQSTAPYGKDYSSVNRTVEDYFTCSPCALKSSLHAPTTEDRLSHAEASTSVVCDLKDKRINDVQESIDLEVSRMISTIQSTPEKALKLNVDQDLANQPSTSSWNQESTESVRKKRDKRQLHFHIHRLHTSDTRLQGYEMKHPWLNKESASHGQAVNEPPSPRQTLARTDSPVSSCLPGWDQKFKDLDSRWIRMSIDPIEESRESQPFNPNDSTSSKHNCSTQCNTVGGLSGFAKAEPTSNESCFTTSCSNGPADYSIDRKEY